MTLLEATNSKPSSSIVILLVFSGISSVMSVGTDSDGCGMGVGLEVKLFTGSEFHVSSNL